MMTTSVREAAFAHARQVYPRESCGLIVVRKGKASYVGCNNLAIGTDQFAIDPKDYARADRRGVILGVVHSHPNGSPQPSQADLVGCEASQLPWHIVGCPSGEWASFEPTGYRAPLVGRQWSHGVLDCYSIIRDWYKEARSIELLDFTRRDEWWHQGENLYLENYETAGFVPVDDEPLEGDVLLMQVGSPVPNHAAIYLGDGLILHHLQNRLSSRDVYGGYWHKNTTHILRYIGEHSLTSR